ncbi:MAG: transposase domain-containing protein [Terracidiphilus sp.]
MTFEPGAGVALLARAACWSRDLSKQLCIIANRSELRLRKRGDNRQNYLFIGGDSGGQRVASLYCLIGTAKRNGLDPAFYVRMVLATIAKNPINGSEELLPWDIPSSRQTASCQAI